MSVEQHTLLTQQILKNGFSTASIFEKIMNYKNYIYNNYEFIKS